MTQKMTSLWNRANELGIGAEYNRLSRNPDVTARANFKAEREVIGTRAWAICKCMGLQTANYDDATCNAILAALN